MLPVQLQCKAEFNKFLTRTSAFISIYRETNNSSNNAKKTNVRGN